MNKQSMKWMAGLGLAVAMVCQVQAAGKTELVQRLVTAQRAQIQELSRSMVVGAVQGLMQELNAALGQVPEAKRDAVRAKLEAELGAQLVALRVSKGQPEDGARKQTGAAREVQPR